MLSKKQAQKYFEDTGFDQEECEMMSDSFIKAQKRFHEFFDFSGDKRDEDSKKELPKDS